jgi:hypothetical protein
MFGLDSSVRDSVVAAERLQGFGVAFVKVNRIPAGGKPKQVGEMPLALREAAPHSRKPHPKTVAASE